uniref:Uncharacterized protein n=1 Tax=Laticauda laticaudata TaxID=8630 RepID=A0A8C5SJ59_LATLA
PSCLLSLSYCPHLLVPNSCILTHVYTYLLPYHICEVGEFLCHDHVSCVSQNWLCDGDPDCPDESDESSCE